MFTLPTTFNLKITLAQLSALFEHRHVNSEKNRDALTFPELVNSQITRCLNQGKTEIDFDYVKQFDSEIFGKYEFSRWYYVEEIQSQFLEYLKKSLIVNEADTEESYFQGFNFINSHPTWYDAELCLKTKRAPQNEIHFEFMETIAVMDFVLSEMWAHNPAGDDVIFDLTFTVSRPVHAKPEEKCFQLDVA